MPYFIGENDVHSIEGGYTHLCRQGLSGQNLSIIAVLYEEAKEADRLRAELEKANIKIKEMENKLAYLSE